MTPNSSRLSTSEQRDEARDIVLRAGFDRVGFAAAGRAHHADRFRSWLDRGFAGTMDYLARSFERRTDPKKVLEGAQTVIALAVHYEAAVGKRSGNAPGTPARIASYAQGTDYHRVIEPRLKAACFALNDRFPASYRYYVDTGPILERDWAEKAGIGWIGKNTCSIDPTRGSYFFIAVILTTLEIAPDTPATNHCGTCRLCMDACPTAAIVAPYELDSRLCISYLTIEHHGEIPKNLEPQVADMVFGCDICQDVCPFNRADRLSSDSELVARKENEAPALEELANLDAEGFRTRFPRSAVRRAKHEGFLRNVIVALGNSRRPDAAAALQRLDDREDVVRNPSLTAALARAKRRSNIVT